MTNNDDIKKRHHHHHHHHKKHHKDGHHSDETMRLSEVSKMYDVHNEGKLDDIEKQMYKMDKEHTGHIPNEKVYDMMKEQMAMSQEIFNLKRFAVILGIFALLLAMSNLGTAWAAAVLAKDTTSEHGALVDKDTHEVLATKGLVEKFEIQAIPSSSNTTTNRRAQQVISGVTSGGTLQVSALQAQQMYSACLAAAGPVILRRTLSSGEPHEFAICPSSFTKLGQEYRYSNLPHGVTGEVIISCNSNNDGTCAVRGSAMAFPLGSTCQEDADCASRQCLLNVCSTFEGGTKWYYKLGGTGDGKSPASPYGGKFNRLRKKFQPGDTVYLMGIISNEGYNPNYQYTNNPADPYLWRNNVNSFSLRDVRGAKGRYIDFRPYDENTKIVGDAANLFRIAHCSYIRIIGFEIEGIVEKISRDTALQLQFKYRMTGTTTVLDRAPVYAGPTSPDDDTYDKTVFQGLTKFKAGDIERPSYTDTRGLYVSDSDHVVIQNNHIHHAPGNGLRVAKSEYVDIIENEVNDCSRKSYSGTHGLVPTFTTDNILNDPAGAYRVRVLRNVVHHNYNEIYSWAPTKDMIHPYIDEGKGISLQRNQEWKNGGRILVAGNIAYWNGFSGVHSQDGDNIDFIGNTAYMNSYTNTITYGGIRSGNALGISTQGGKDSTLANNLVVIDLDTQGLPVSIANPGTGFVVEKNLVHGISYKTKSTTQPAMRTESDFQSVNVFFQDPVVNADPGLKFSGSNELNINHKNGDFIPQTTSTMVATPSYYSNNFYTNLDFYETDRSVSSTPRVGAIESDPSASDAEEE